MSLKRLEYGKTWRNSGDFPTHEDSEQQVRADLQYHPDAIRDYLNETVAPAVDDLEQEQQEMGRTLDEHGQAIVDLALGTPPEAVRACRVEFGVEDWTGAEGEGPTLRIGQIAHRRQNGNFGHSLWELVEGESRSGSWNTVGTDVGWDGQTGEVVLRGPCAYAGAIVFYGV